MPQPSQRAAYVLQEVGIRPWEATVQEIELAERLMREHRYIEAAAEELSTILRGHR